MNAKHTKPRHW